jgi:hypothetical protein
LSCMILGLLVRIQWWSRMHGKYLQLVGAAVTLRSNGARFTVIDGFLAI